MVIGKHFAFLVPFLLLVSSCSRDGDFDPLSHSETGSGAVESGDK